MKFKTTLILFIVLAIIGYLLFLSYKKNTNGSYSGAASVQGVREHSTSSTLVASSTAHNFGLISMKNGIASVDFTITNPTNEDISINRVETSCMCTTATLSGVDGVPEGPFGMTGMGKNSTNLRIRAGETIALRVDYDPNAHGPAGVGAMNRFVSVSDSNGGMLRFSIKGNVTP